VKITKSGIYDISAAEYHADPVAAGPSLSASIAHILLSSSAQHAWFAHPKLNPAYQSEESEAFDLGTAAHAYLLEGEKNFVIVQAPDWRTKLAKDARDDARAQGKIPLLADRWGDVQGMALAARQQLEQHDDPPRPFLDGRPEETLIWQEGDVWCRARTDWLHADHRTIDDLKTTSASANPDVWTRGPLFSSGYDVQAAFYLRGLKAIFGTEGVFRFVVQENFPPYALSVVGLAPDALALADRKVSRALTLWRHCLTTNTWPGYPQQTCYAEAPAWETSRWEEQEYRLGAAPPDIDDGRPLSDQLLGGSR
jgi:PDDEXK-like uncharacterized protein DUF3799